MSEQEESKNIQNILIECENLLRANPGDNELKKEIATFYFTIGQNIISYWHKILPKEDLSSLNSGRELLARAIEVAPINSPEKTILVGQYYALEIGIAGYQNDFVTAASYLTKIHDLSKNNPTIDPTEFFIHLGNIFLAKEGLPAIESLFIMIIEQEELRKINLIPDWHLEERHKTAIEFWESLLLIMPTNRWDGRTSYLLRAHTCLKLKISWIKACQGKWGEVINLLNSACFYAETVDFEFYEETIGSCLKLLASFPDGYKYEPSLIRLHIGISGRSPFWEGH